MPLEPSRGWAAWLAHLKQFADGEPRDAELLRLFAALREHSGDDAMARREWGKISTQIFNLVKEQGELFLCKGQEEQEASDRLWFAENLLKFCPKDGTEKQNNHHTKAKIAKPPSLCNAVARYINSNRYWQKRQGWDAAREQDKREKPLDVAENRLPSKAEPQRSLHELLEHEPVRRQLQARSVQGTDPTLSYDLFLAGLLDEALAENLTERIDRIAIKHGVTKAKLRSYCYREFYPFLKDLYNKGL